MRISKKLLLIIVALFVISYYPITYSVKGETNFITLYNFDNVGAGVSSGSSGYGTWSIDIDAYGFTSTDYDFSSPNSLKLNVGYSPSVIAYFNLTNGEIMNGCEVGLHLNGAGSSYVYVVFYDDLDQEVVKFRISAYNVPNSCFAVYDYASTSYQTLLTYSGGGIDKIYNNYTYFGFQNNFTVGVSPINYVYYYLKNSTGGLICDGEYSYNSDYQYIGNNVTLKKIKIINSGYTGNDNYIYFDDFKITQEDFSSDLDFDDYLQYCEGAIYHHADIESKYLSIYSDSTFTGTIKTFDFWVNMLQLTLISNDLEDYSAYINGISLGNPTKIVGTIGSEYCLRWEYINLNIQNERILLNLYSSQHYTNLGHTFYWYNLPMGNMVGNSGIGLSNNPALFGIDWFGYDSMLNYDARFCLYYENIIPVTPNCELDDDIVIGRPYGIYIYQPVFINYFVSSVTNTTVRVLLDDVPLHTEYVTSCEGDFEILPTFEDSFLVEINRSGTRVFSKAFFVSDNVSPTYNNSKLWSNKYRVDVGEFFTLNWLYNKSAFNNTNGAIIWGTTPEFTNIYMFNSMVMNIEGNNINEGYSHSFQIEGDYYIMLVYSDGSTVYKLSMVKIIVGSGSTIRNEIYTDKNIYDQKFILGLGRYLAEVKIGGSHNFAGQNVYIDINNGATKIPVGSYSRFNMPFYAPEGTYIARLMLNNDNVLLELDNCTFIVNKLGGTTPTDPTPPPTKTEGLKQYGLIIGLFTVLGLSVGIFMITNSTLVFASVGGITSYMLSRPELGIYQLFPVEVGIAIIVIIVFIGVIAYFFS